MKASQKELNASSDRLEIAELTYETGSGCLTGQIIDVCVKLTLSKEFSFISFNSTDYCLSRKFDFISESFPSFSPMVT